jgi:uncharacterized delta-60 repeat protein
VTLGGPYAVDRLEALLLDCQGRTYVLARGAASGKEAMVVAALNASGSLDPAFGAGGYALLDGDGSGGAFSPRVAAMQADGKLLVAGVNGAGSTGCLLRVKADGTLDPAFGTTGRRTFPVYAGMYGGLGLAGLAQRPDGRILLAGNASGPKAWVKQFLATGADDPSFGVGGEVTYSACRTISPLAWSCARMGKPCSQAPC